MSALPGHQFAFVTAARESHGTLRRPGLRRRREQIPTFGPPTGVFGEDAPGEAEGSLAGPQALLKTLSTLRMAGLPIPGIQAVGAIQGNVIAPGPPTGFAAQGVPQGAIQGPGAPPQAVAQGPGAPPVPTVGGPTTAASIARLGSPQPITNPLRTRLRQ